MKMVMESKMMVVKVKKAEMIKEFPKSKKWIKKIKKLRSGEDLFDKKKIEYYFTCTPSHIVQMDSESIITMPFEERLEFELDTVNVNAMVKHNSFVIADLLPVGVVPESVKKIVAEITKVKMMIECQITGDEEIRKTIPEIDKTKVDPDLIRKSLNGINSDEDEILDIDEILDKIIDFGMESLTMREIEFLKKQGK
jgi:hypothetical protein